MKSINWLCFCFIGLFMMGLTIGLDEAVGLTISKAMSMRRNITDSFFG